ncbi:MAG: amidohydrolase family protein [Candidatus Thorarchaeota archaeon]
MMGSLLIDNVLVVTCNSNNDIIEHGYVYVEDDKIEEIGTGSPSTTPSTHIDGSGCVLIPGLITAHTHLYGILLRGADLGIEPPTDFAQVLQRVWWPVDEALTLEDAHASALSASADMLKSGSTLFADTYSGPNSIDGSLQAIADATKSVGIRSILAFEMTERHNPEEARNGLEENIKFINEAKKEPLVSGMMSVHASFTVGDEIVKEAASTASKLDAPITVHTSEGKVDLYHNLERWGERTVERLDRLELLDSNAVLAHCVHVSENELELIMKRDAKVAHNPMSNMLNAVGTAPVPDMLDLGITVGLGNDGWIYDPFENMRCAMTVHRLASGNPSEIGPAEVFHMATIGGARCYGLEDQLGSIETGKLADLVLLDGTNVPTPLNGKSVMGHLVNTFTGRDVSDVVVNGDTVVENGMLTKVDEESVIQKSRQSAKKLWKRLK